MSARIYRFEANEEMVALLNGLVDAIGVKTSAEAITLAIGLLKAAQNMVDAGKAVWDVKRGKVEKLVVTDPT